MNDSEVIQFPDRSEDRKREEWAKGELRLSIAMATDSAFRFGLSNEQIADELKEQADQLNKGEIR